MPERRTRPSDSFKRSPSPGVRGPRRRPNDEDVLGGRVIEGRRAVAELLRARRRRVEAVYVTSGAERSLSLEEIVALAHEQHVPLRWIEREELEHRSRSAAAQGVLAEAAPIGAVGLDELVANATGSLPFLVVLDGITDPQNFGALLRSALGAGVTGVVVRRHRAVHLTPSALKAAAGAAEYLPIAVVGGIAAALGTLQRHGVWCVGLDADGETNIENLALADAPLALVLGAEGSGLSALVAQRCDSIAKIALSGPIASLNVAAAGAVACFFVAERRRALSRGIQQPAG